MSDPGGSKTFQITADETDAGNRLDRVLSARVADHSRSRLQALVKAGAVKVGERCVADPSAKVQVGDVITLVVPPAEPATPEAEAIALNVVFEDDALIVIDKPAGLVVHPAPGNRSGTLVNALLAHCADSLSGIGGERRPGIVHRLDKNTSGLLVVAKTDKAHRRLAKQFASHGQDGALERIYQALVWGTFDRPSGSVSEALGRSPANRTKMAVVPKDKGQHAVTHFEVQERYVDREGRPIASCISVHLETGRTHQIRVHMAHVGHPVMADPDYATGFKTAANRLTPPAQQAISKLGRQALHAVRLGFVHPITGDAMRFDSPLPQDIAALRAALAAGQI